MLSSATIVFLKKCVNSNRIEFKKNYLAEYNKLVEDDVILKFFPFSCDNSTNESTDSLVKNDVTSIECCLTAQTYINYTLEKLKIESILVYRDMFFNKELRNFFPIIVKSLKKKENQVKTHKKISGNILDVEIEKLLHISEKCLTLKEIKDVLKETLPESYFGGKNKNHVLNGKLGNAHQSDFLDYGYHGGSDRTFKIKTYKNIIGTVSRTEKGSLRLYLSILFFRSYALAPKIEIAAVDNHGKKIKKISGENNFLKMKLFSKIKSMKKITKDDLQISYSLYILPDQKKYIEKYQGNTRIEKLMKVYTGGIKNSTKSQAYVSLCESYFCVDNIQYQLAESKQKTIFVFNPTKSFLNEYSKEYVKEPYIGDLSFTFKIVKS